MGKQNNSMRLDGHLPSRRRMGATCILIALALSLAGCSATPNAKLKLPLGYLETPVSNTVLRGTGILSGWALSEDGIDQIAVYVDRTFLQYGKVSGLRPDVIKAFPEFAGTTDMQWSAQVDTSTIPVGAHQLLARAISKKGAVRDLGMVVVTVER